MKKFLFNLLIQILTFTIGVGIYRTVSPNISIATISEYTFFYDGMDVEIETYVQLKGYDKNDWYIGEPFEKKEVLTSLNLEQNSTDLDALHFQLKENLSEENYKRAKVLVRGTVKDDCKIDRSESGTISFGCCFGKSITLQAKEVVQLSPVEDYTRPENQFDH